MAITANKPVVQLGDGVKPPVLALGVKASTNIPAGAIVATDATGYAVNATTSTTLICWGIADAAADNSSGASGDIKVKVRGGIHKFKNSSAGDAITVTELGKDVYVVDNETAAKTDGGATRSVLGKVVQVDSDGVFVSVSAL